MKLYPTGHCFDDALEFLSLRVQEDPLLVHGSSLRLVHAIVRYPENRAEIIPEFQHRAGERFSHAWVEEDELFVWDGALTEDGAFFYYRVELWEFYKEMRPERMTKYTVREAILENDKTNNYGPWEQVYLELCR